MKLATIIVFLFYGLNAGLTEPPAADPCENLKVKTKINYISDELNTGRIDVKVEGGVKPYHYVFFDKKGKPLSEEIRYNYFNFSSKETIFCRIMDGNGCKETIEITIK
jgi:hypothetical protein